MSCTHERIRCTDNVYYCITCGAELPAPDRVKETAEGQKKTAKRRTKKEAE